MLSGRTPERGRKTSAYLAPAFRGAPRCLTTHTGGAGYAADAYAGPTRNSDAAVVPIAPHLSPKNVAEQVFSTG